MLSAARPVELSTARLRLWLPEPQEAAAMLRFQVENLDHLAPWMPARPSGFTTLDYWHEHLLRDRREYAEDHSLRLAVARLEDRARIIGLCSFTEFIRGPVQMCQLGYALAQDQQGQGVMTEALRRAIAFVFEELEMHRVHASYSPLNVRSGAVLERLGFTVEGYARKLLYVDGAWRDHLMAALINPSPGPPRP